MLQRLWNLIPAKTLHGYDHPELVDLLFRKNAAYQPTEPWPEMANVSSVLDVGGSFGLHYKQAANPTVRWAIVESDAIVSRARDLETGRLRFFRTISEASAWLENVEVVHCNGALQYTPDPLATVREAVSLRPKKLMWYRVFFGEGTGTQISRLKDNGPGRIKVPYRKVAYRFRRVPEREFIEAHHGYTIERRDAENFLFAACIDPAISGNRIS